MPPSEWQQERHRAFVDDMHPRFGYTSHPGYAVVRILPVISSGGFNPPKDIVINDTHENKDSFEKCVYHESAHFLHPFYRRFWDLPKGSEALEKTYSLRELVAHFGAMIYTRETDGMAAVETYFKGHKPEADILAARDLLDHPELLERICHANMDEANEIISGFTRHRITLG